MNVAGASRSSPALKPIAAMLTINCQQTPIVQQAKTGNRMVIALKLGMQLMVFAALGHRIKGGRDQIPCLPWAVVVTGDGCKKDLAFPAHSALPLEPTPTAILCYQGRFNRTELPCCQPANKNTNQRQRSGVHHSSGPLLRNSLLIFDSRRSLPISDRNVIATSKPTPGILRSAS